MTSVSNIEIFRDGEGEWRWRAKARNGEEIASSGEGYEHKMHAISQAVDLYPGAEVTES